MFQPDCQFGQLATWLAHLRATWPNRDIFDVRMDWPICELKYSFIVQFI